MSRAAEAREESALEIRFGPLELAQVRVRTVDPGAILDELTGRVATAPRFFERTAVGLDLSLLDKEPDARELRAVLDAVRRAGMLPVGLMTGPPFAATLARVANRAGTDLMIWSLARPSSASVTWPANCTFIWAGWLTAY